MKDSSRFIKTPSLSVADVTSNCSYRFGFEKTGNTKVQVEFNLRGDDFEKLISLKSELTKEKVSEYIRQFMPFKNFSIQSWSLERKNRDDLFIKLKASLTLNDQPRTLDESLVFDLPALDLSQYEKPSRRKLPLHLSSPMSFHDTLVYFIPQGYAISTSTDKKAETKFGNWQIQSTTQENILTVVRNFVLFAGDIPLADYPSFYSFVNTVKDSERKYKLIYKLLN